MYHACGQVGPLCLPSQTTTVSISECSRLTSMGYPANEQLLVFCVSLYQIHVGHEFHQYCTTDHKSDHPGQIVTGVVYLRASAIIIANHRPSGDSAPSQRQVAVTIEMRETCEHSNILLHHDSRMGGGKTRVVLKAMSILACFCNFLTTPLSPHLPKRRFNFSGIVSRVKER